MVSHVILPGLIGTVAEVFRLNRATAASFSRLGPSAIDKVIEEPGVHS